MKREIILSVESEADAIKKHFCLNGLPWEPDKLITMDVAERIDGGSRQTTSDRNHFSVPCFNGFAIGKTD